MGTIYIVNYLYRYTKRSEDDMNGAEIFHIEKLIKGLKLGYKEKCFGYIEYIKNINKDVLEDYNNAKKWDEKFEK